MRRMIVGMLFLILASGVALAQSTRGERRGWGYVVGGVGATSGNGISTATFQVGGGGGGLAYKGLGFGAEVGYRRRSNIPAKGSASFP